VRSIILREWGGGDGKHAFAATNVREVIGPDAYLAHVILRSVLVELAGIGLDRR